MTWDEFEDFLERKFSVRFDEHEYPPDYYFTIIGGKACFTDDDIEKNKLRQIWEQEHGAEYSE